MKVLYLRTPYGSQYHIWENGNIKRLDQRDFVPSGDWTMLGIEHVKKSRFIPLADLFQSVPANLLYKNGKPQWTVRDLDHGSQRSWGNTRAHGVYLLYAVEISDDTHSE